MAAGRSAGSILAETPSSRIIGVAVASAATRAPTSFEIAMRPLFREDLQRSTSNFEQIPSNRLNIQAATKGRSDSEQGRGDHV
jgi:hypothetical protein